MVVMAAADPFRSIRGVEHRPTATWVLMLLALVFVLLIPDWTGSGRSRPVWLFLTPIFLGLLGAAFAVHTRHFWWAFASALWGLVLIQGLVIVVTLISGP